MVFIHSSIRLSAERVWCLVYSNSIEHSAVSVVQKICQGVNAL